MTAHSTYATSSPAILLPEYFRPSNGLHRPFSPRSIGWMSTPLEVSNPNGLHRPFSRSHECGEIDRATLQWHFAERHFPWNLPGNRPPFLPVTRFVPLSSRCDTLEAPKLLVRAVHQKRETHEVPSSYHRSARRAIAPADRQLVTGLAPVASASEPLLRAPRSTPTRAALPASHPE